MQNINELIGIINGINYDGIINEKEIDFLQNWVNKNRNYSTSHQHEKLIKFIDNALEDRVLTEEERKCILDIAEKVNIKKIDSNSLFDELNGIIEGIISDDEVNEFEIFNLHEWFIKNKDLLGHNSKEKQIKNAIYQVLEDGIIDVEEQNFILALLKEKIEESKLDIKIKHLRQLIKQKKNIGIELIDLLDKSNNMNYIHCQAEYQLKKALKSYGSIHVQDPEIVVISLSLIAMLNYNGVFYDSVEKIYSNLYEDFGKQRIECLIRDILTRYRSNEEKVSRSRIINVVLKHAIVPKYFLSNFFEFIYDIYKLNFDYDLTGDLFSEFTFIYEGLISNLNSEGDKLELNVTHKTYRLIQTTKDLVVNDKKLDSIINLSIMVINIIDKHIWGNDLKITNSYFKEGYEQWAKSINKSNDIKEKQNINFRSHWEPKYKLLKNKVVLVPPIHKVKAQYNYADIKITIEKNGKKIYENKTPYIKEIFGGYQIELPDINLEAPIGCLRYLLKAGEEVIYDSKEKLNRKFIIFDQNGVEIKNNTDYKGIATFCSNEKISNTQEYFVSKEFHLSVANVKYGDSFIVDDEIFNFTSLIKPGIFGEEYLGYFVYDIKDNKELQVYKKIKYLVFEDFALKQNYEITINNKTYMLSNFNTTITQKDGINKYVVDLNIDKPDIYSITVKNNQFDKKLKVVSFEFVYDPKLEIQTVKIDENNYLVSLNSGIVENEIIEEIQIDYFDFDIIKFINRGKEYSYRVPFGIKLYQISENKWSLFEKDIWINDINQDSILKIYGTDADSVLISNGKILDDNLQLKDKGSYKYLSIGFLNAYKTLYDYIDLFLLKGGKVVDAIRCYNKCVVEKNGVQTIFDSIKNEVEITVNYKGQGMVYVELVDEENKQVYQSNIIVNGQSIVVSNLESFVKYKINICEKKKGLLRKGNEILNSFEKIFYSRKEYVGKSFRINEVYFNQIINKQFVEKSYHLKKTYVKFEKQINENMFSGQIYAKTKNGLFYLFRINPVEIEICSDVVDESMDLYITNNGDGLLLDFEHCGIMNSLDDDKAVDIFLYSVDMEV